VGLYIAGYSKFYINKSYIQGSYAGIGIKSGLLNIDGATIMCNGENKTPTQGYNNGINPSGTAIQIESNNGYQGNIELNISSGNIISKNSNVIYEYIGKGEKTQVKSINITGGSYKSEANKNVFSFSNSFNETHKNFITGGEYSSSPNTYLKNGYSTNIENGTYIVIKDAIKEVFSIQNNDKNLNEKKTFITITLVIILIVLAYYNKSIQRIIIKFVKK